MALPPAAPRLLLVDGYNLLHAARRPLGLDRLDLDAARHRLLQHIEDTARSLARSVIVVFDSPQARSRPEPSAFRMQVVFASGGLTADGWIERKVAQSARPQAVLVITSDQMIRRTVEAAGAQVQSSEDFLRACAADAGPLPARPLSRTARPLAHALEGLSLPDPAGASEPDLRDVRAWWRRLGELAEPGPGRVLAEAGAEAVQAACLTRILRRPDLFDGRPAFRLDRQPRIVVVGPDPARTAAAQVLAESGTTETLILRPRIFARWWKRAVRAVTQPFPLPFSMLRIGVVDRLARDEAGQLAEYHQLGPADRLWLFRVELTAPSGALAFESHLTAWDGTRTRDLFSPYETWHRAGPAAMD